MGRVRVKSVTNRDPDKPVGPILLRFEHAAVKPKARNVDLNRVFRTGVFETDLAAAASKKDYSYLSRSVYESRMLAATGSKSVKKRNVVALQSDEMTYIGTKGFDNPSLPSSSDDLMKTYVALKDKNKLRIFEVTPMTVSPYFKGHSFVTEDERDTSKQTTQEERRAKGIDLVKSFGSKIKRLTYERREKNEINIADMQSSIDNAIGNLEVVESEPVTKDTSILTLIPPCDREAASASDVYKLEDILNSRELEAMDELVQAFAAASAAEMKKWREDRVYSEYFVTTWTKLKPQLPRTNQLAKIVLYTELLILFSKLRHEQVRKKTVKLPEVFPMWMREKVLDNFTVLNANGSRNRPDAYKDKACCYIMVLVLLANNLHLDVNLMSASVNFHINKLLMLAKAVGITVIYNSTSKEYKAYLKVPLPKPIETRGRRRALNSK